MLIASVSATKHADGLTVGMRDCMWASVVVRPAVLRVSQDTKRTSIPIPNIQLAESNYGDRTARSQCEVTAHVLLPRGLRSVVWGGTHARIVRRFRQCLLGRVTGYYHISGNLLSVSDKSCIDTLAQPAGSDGERIQLRFKVHPAVHQLCAKQYL
jgi:hypothetical protein